jgi:hypothetical protein
MDACNTAMTEYIHADRTPDWAKETVPDKYRPFLGRFGLPEPFASKPSTLGGKVEGIDRWQANRFVVWRPETAAWLYDGYTPTKVDYRPGLLPAYEKLAREYAGAATGNIAKAEALLTRALPERIPHATVPPVGAGCTADRALLDEPLLASGCAFCNEQARVFIRLCQVCGIQARMVFLFYADKQTGHTTAEFWTGEKWAMVDVSWYVLFPGPDGKLMTTAECHGSLPNRAAMAEAYYKRMGAIIALGDEQIAGRAVPAGTPDRAAVLRAKAETLRTYVREFHNKKYLAIHLWEFGLLNYPLPA